MPSGKAHRASIYRFIIPACRALLTVNGAQTHPQRALSLWGEDTRVSR